MSTNNHSPCDALRFFRTHDVVSELWYALLCLQLLLRCLVALAEMAGSEISTHRQVFYKPCQKNSLIVTDVWVSCGTEHLQR